MSTSASVGPNLQDTGTDLASDPGLDCQVTERVEAEMLRVCTRYLLLAEIGRQNLFSEEQTAIEQLPQEVDLFSNDEGPIEYNPYCSWEVWEETMIRYDPTERGFGEFFVYASCHWVDHFGAVASEPLPDLESIENICLAGSTRFQNWTEQNRRPDCVIRPRVEFDSSLYDALGITSLFGSERMLRHTLDHSDFSNGKFLSEPAMGAADQIFQWGDLSRLVILFNTSGELENQLQNLDFFRLAITRWSNSYTHPRDSPHWNLVFDLVNNVLDVMTVEKWGNELLCIAAGKGCVPVIQRLMNGARCNAGLRAELLRETRHKHHRVVFGKPVHQSIGEAILENHLDVVEYLLRQDGIEAHLQYRNHHGENVLHLASKTCNPEVFRLLVPRFEGGIHQADEQGNTPLSRAILSTAASQNRSESVGILLGATRGHPNSYFECEQHPLRIAVQLCDLNMCRLLITTGKFDPAVALRLDTNGSKVLRDEYFGDAQTASDILQLLCRYANSGSTSG